MDNQTIVTLLNNYLEDRKHKRFSSENFKNELRKLGKSEEEIHELYIEFDDEWTKEEMSLLNLKKSKGQMLLGALLAVGMGTASVLSAVQVFDTGKRGMIIFYGAVAAGLLLVMKGFNDMRMEKIRKKRRIMKWAAWKSML